MRDYGIPICSDIDHDVAVLHFDIIIDILCKVIIAAYWATLCVFCEPELADWNVTSSHMVGVVRRMATPVATGRHIVPNSAAKSKVWEHFGFPGNDYGTVANSKVAICRICEADLPFKNNATNIFTHVLRHHKDVHAKLHPSSAVSMHVGKAVWERRNEIFFLLPPLCSLPLSSNSSLPAPFVPSDSCRLTVCRH